jgi:hypothetical protein
MGIGIAVFLAGVAIAFAILITNAEARKLLRTLLKGAVMFAFGLLFLGLDIVAFFFYN